MNAELFIKTTNDKAKKAVFVHVMQVHGVSKSLNLLILNLITRWTIS